jgi:transcriptional regulator with XRE-family HTH domain
LAQQLGPDWSASTVRRIERGARKATPQQIAQLADALEVPVAQLELSSARAPLPIVCGRSANDED